MHLLYKLIALQQVIHICTVLKHRFKL